MPIFLPHTSCFVAIDCQWHVHHDAATREAGRRLTAGASLVLATPSLVEAYTVLTRLPPPHRLPPVQALQLLRTTFVDAAVAVMALDAATVWRLLEDCAVTSVAGGGFYDAQIVECAAGAGVDAILTFNERQFQFLGRPSIRIVVPFEHSLGR